MYSLETWFVSGIYVKIPCRKEIKMLIIIIIIIEIQRMWNIQTKVIPVIIVATRTILNSLRLYLCNVPGIHEIKELKKKST
jgi:hypothetical protein